jgi:hypothetical protein
MNAGAAMFKLAVEAHDRALAVGHRTLRQQANELGHQLLANRPAGFEQLGKILDVTTR